MSKKNGKLSLREKRFCELYTVLGDPVKAASAAGYESPEKAGSVLLSRDEINCEIGGLFEKRLKNIRQKAYAGYEKIAFGSVNDAVRLLFENESFSEDGGSYDLFNVAEIKRPKEGALEIKFFDRLKALEKLEQYDREEEKGSSDFYRALVGGIRKLNDESGDKEE